MNFKHLPKVELHVHLDCCLSYEVVQMLDSSINRNRYERDFQANGRCEGLAQYLQRATRAVDLMQDRRALRLVTDDLFNQLATDRVVYAEIRFAPLLHTRKGLSGSDVVEIVSHAVAENIMRTGIPTSIILCTLRHYTMEESMITAELVHAFRDRHVVALDLAADEAGYTIHNHIAAFGYARRCGLYTTAHAGEACSAESVWETIEELKPDRIGHGVRASEDASLVKLIIQKGVHLEICPSSNIQTNIYQSVAHHPIQELLQAGISLSVNTDGRTICGTSLCEEYTKLQHAFGWNLDDYRRINQYAVEAAFIARNLKDELATVITQAYGVSPQL